MNHDLLWDALDKVQYGSLTIIMPDSTQRTFKGEEHGYKSTLIIKDLDCIDLVIKGGDVAFGETYMKDMWEVDSLPNLLSFMTQNSECLENFFHAR